MATQGAKLPLFAPNFFLAPVAGIVDGFTQEFAHLNLPYRSCAVDDASSASGGKGLPLALLG
jgi:hypothetical protein